MDYGAAQGKALFPSARKYLCEAMPEFLNARKFYYIVFSLLFLFSGDRIYAAIEIYILLHRKIVIKGELLRHISDVLFYLLLIFDNVVPADCPFSRSRH